MNENWLIDSYLCLHLFVPTAGWTKFFFSSLSYSASWEKLLLQLRLNKIKFLQVWWIFIFFLSIYSFSSLQVVLLPWTQPTTRMARLMMCDLKKKRRGSCWVRPWTTVNGAAWGWSTRSVGLAAWRSCRELRARASIGRCGAATPPPTAGWSQAWTCRTAPSRTRWDWKQRPLWVWAEWLSNVHSERITEGGCWEYYVTDENKETALRDDHVPRGKDPLKSKSYDELKIGFKVSVCKQNWLDFTWSFKIRIENRINLIFNPRVILVG